MSAALMLTVVITCTFLQILVYCHCNYTSSSLQSQSNNGTMSPATTENHERDSSTSPFHFPGDGCYVTTVLQASPSSIGELAKKAYLNNTLMDCLLQMSGRVWDECQDTMIGDFGCEDTITKFNEKPPKRIARTRTDFLNMLHRRATTDVPHRLVVPVLQTGHFFVACFDFSIHDPRYFVDISFYDSFVPGCCQVLEGQRIRIVKR